MPTPPLSLSPKPEFSTPGGNGVTSESGASFGQRAADAVNDRRESVARGLDSAAAALHDRADAMAGGQVPHATRAAAGAMEDAADYVRDHEFDDMVADVKQLAKKHPGAILLTAAAVGFLLARSLSRH